MELHEIVETSRRVAAIAGRRAKIELLASCLRALRAAWVEAAVGLLSGAPRQGKIGIGYATLREARKVLSGGHADAHPRGSRCRA